MNAIVSILPKPNNILSWLRLTISPPFSCQKAAIGTESVHIYTLNPLWKLCFGKIVARLKKKHAYLLFDQSVKAYPKIYWESPPSALFYERFSEILSCFCGGNFITPAVVSMEPDERLLPVLEALSHHARAVTLCTADSHWFEDLSREALHRWGLSLNERDPKTADLTVILSLGEHTLAPKNPVIDLSDKADHLWENCLMDFSDQAVAEFMLGFPHLHIKHCYLVPENGKIRNLIWKIQKKS